MTPKERARAQVAALKASNAYLKNLADALPEGMTPERRREIEEEEQLRNQLRKHPKATPLEKWGCIYPLIGVGAACLAAAIITIIVIIVQMF